MCCDINNQLPVLYGCISNIRNNRQKQKVEYAANPNAGAHGSLFENQIEENKTDKISCGICNQVNGCKTAKHCVQLEHLDGQGKEKAKENITENVALFEQIVEIIDIMDTNLMSNLICR